MIRIKLICIKCGYKFEKEVFEKDEAKEKKLRPYPVRCPKCGGSVEKQ